MNLPLRDVALAALAAVTVALCVHTVTRDPSASGDRLVQATAASESSPAPTSAAVRTVTVIADDYASSPVHGFPLQLAKRLGWQVSADMLRGSGYVFGPVDAPDLSSRVSAALGADPDLVVIALGLVDARQEDLADAALSEAARSAFAQLIGRRVLVVGPFWPGTASERAAEVDDLIAAEADRAGLMFVSPTDERWLMGVAADPKASLRAFLDADLVRPSAVGSKVISDRLEARARELGLAPAAAATSSGSPTPGPAAS